MALSTNHEAFCDLYFLQIKRGQNTMANNGIIYHRMENIQINDPVGLSHSSMERR